MSGGGQRLLVLALASAFYLLAIAIRSRISRLSRRNQGRHIAAAWLLLLLPLSVAFLAGLALILLPIDTAALATGPSPWLMLLVHLTNASLIFAILTRIAPSARLTGTIIYAWNPLVLVDSVSSGRDDGLVICLLLLVARLSLQQEHHRPQWLYDMPALLLMGLAASTSVEALVLVPLFAWFKVRDNHALAFAILGFCWRMALMLAIAFAANATIFHGGAVPPAITSSFNWQNFTGSPLDVVAAPLRLLFTQLTSGLGYPSSLVQPDAAADTLVLASALFLYLLLYFREMGKMRAFGSVFRGWYIVLLGFVALASTVYKPWPVVWVVWIAALLPLDALASSVLLLSCASLLALEWLALYPASSPVIVALFTFGLPLVYFVGARFAGMYEFIMGKQ